MEISKAIAVFVCWSFVSAILLPSPATGGSISTAEIVDRSRSEDCLEWKISGICIWLKCSIFGCYIKTTPRISHRLPDLVAVAYPNTFDSPWHDYPLDEVISESVKNSNLSGGNFEGIGNHRRQQDSLLFNEVDIVGNPAVGNLDIGRFLCKSVARPLYPYFLSVEDARAWRSAVPDAYREESRTPGMREIGKWPRYTWGSVFPRSGFVFQNHSGKAAAVASQRAIDVVLRDQSGHIADPLSHRRQMRVLRGDPDARTEHACSLSGGAWKLNPKVDSVGKCVQQPWQQWLAKSDETKDRWQILYPVHSRRCETFAQEQQFPHRQTSAEGQYAWNHWKKYKCCVVGGGKLLKAFDF